MNKDRLEWVDFYRGFCFLLVMIFHSDYWGNLCPLYLRWILDPFFLAGFFLLSGYLYKDKPIKFRIVSIVNTLLIPMFVYSFLIGFIDLLYYTIYVIFKGTLSWNDYIVHAEQAIISGGRQFLFAGSGVWFIACLIVLELIYTLYREIAKKKDQYNVMLMIVALGTYFLVTDNKEASIDNYLIWNIDTAVWCMVYFVIGGYLQKVNFISFVKSLSLVICYCSISLYVGYIGIGGGI